MARCRSWTKLPFGERVGCQLSADHKGAHLGVRLDSDIAERWENKRNAEVGGKIIDLMVALKSALSSRPSRSGA